MKDPLHKEQTPYEILNLEPGAGTTDIHEAFKKSLKSLEGRRNINKLKGAREALLDQGRRLMLDFLSYDAEVLNRLKPNPVEDPSHLEPANRADTAKAWSGQLKKSFPDMGIAHSLSVLWYWWSMSEEERFLGSGNNGSVEKQKLSSTPDFESMWRNVVACWVTLSRNTKDWKFTQDLSDDLRRWFYTNLETQLHKDFHNLGQRYRQKGENGLAERYRVLELDLSTEISVAKEVGRVGIRAGGGKICCGRLMLEEVGLVDLVRNTVRAQLKKTPQNEALQGLLIALSEYASIGVLIDNNRPDDALEAIEKLPAKKKRDSEAIRLKARALAARGSQQAEMGNSQDALDAWGKALELSNDGQLTDRIENYIVETCNSQYASLKQHRRDEALSLLESGLALVKNKEKNEDLKLNLGELLTARGIERVNKAQEKAVKSKTGITTSLVKQMKDGVKDLERAVELGSKNAKDQLQAARNALKQAEASKGITEEFEAWLKDANDAAKKKDWDTVINLYRKILKKAGPSPPDHLKKNLAVFLTNRAIENLNKANKLGQVLASAKTVLTRKERRIYNRVQKNRYRSSCALCRFPSPIPVLTQYSVSLPGGGSATLCSNCVSKFKPVLEKLSMPNPDAIFLYASAHDDLLEARKLDPKNGDIKKTLNDVENMLSRLPIDVTQESVKNILKNIKETPQAKPSAKTVPEKKRRPTRGLLHAGFLMVFFAGALGFGLYQLYPVVDGYVSKFIPDQFMGFTALFYIVPLYFILKKFWQNICRTRWKQKKAFLRLLEVSLYVAVLFLSAYIIQSHEGQDPLRAPSLFNAVASKVKTLGGSEGESAKVEPRLSPHEPPARKSPKVGSIRENQKAAGGQVGEATKVAPKVRPKVSAYEPATRVSSKAGAIREERSAAKSTYHEVRPGDSLSRIGDRYGISVKELCDMNKITQDAVIHPGQKLIVKTEAKQIDR